MKAICALILLLVVLISCNSGGAGTPDSKEPGKNIENIALEKLYTLLQNKGVRAELKSNEIHVQENTIKLKINVEHEGKQQDKWLCAISIATTYKAKQDNKITIGSIGVGNSLEEAMGISITEWLATFGEPFSNLLSSDSSDVLVIGNKVVYPGFMGFRGNRPENLFVQTPQNPEEKIFTAIEPLLTEDGKEITPVELKLMIGANGAIDGECKINNIVSAEVLNNMKKLDWTPAAEQYLFKQFYLVKSK